MVEAATERKLKAQASNPDAPGKKYSKGEAADNAAAMPVDDSGDEDEEPPKWAAKMMKKMDKIATKFEEMNDRVGEAVAVSKEAKKEAIEAKEAVADVKGSLAELRDEVENLKGEGLQAEIGKVMEKEWPRLGGKGAGKAPADA